MPLAPDYAPPWIRRGVWNVLDYGADRTGVASSQPALNTIKGLAAAYGGGCIEFPSGVYAINDVLNNVTELEYRGLGGRNVTLTSANNSSDIIALTGNTARIAIRNFYLNGPSAGAGGGISVAAAFGLGFNLLLENLLFQNGTYALNVSKCQAVNGSVLEINGTRGTAIAITEAVANDTNNVWLSTVQGDTPGQLFLSVTGGTGHRFQTFDAESVGGGVFCGAPTSHTLQVIQFRDITIAPQAGFHAFNFGGGGGTTAELFVSGCLASGASAAFGYNLGGGIVRASFLDNTAKDGVAGASGLVVADGTGSSEIEIIGGHYRNNAGNGILINSALTDFRISNTRCLANAIGIQLAAVANNNYHLINNRGTIVDSTTGTPTRVVSGNI